MSGVGNEGRSNEGRTGFFNKFKGRLAGSSSSMSGGSAQSSPQGKPLKISEPISSRSVAHVSYDAATDRFCGLPPAMQEQLDQSGLTQQELTEGRDLLMKILPNEGAVTGRTTDMLRRRIAKGIPARKANTHGSLTMALSGPSSTSSTITTSVSDSHSHSHSHRHDSYEFVAQASQQQLALETLPPAWQTRIGLEPVDQHLFQRSRLPRAPPELLQLQRKRALPPTPPTTLPAGLPSLSPSPSSPLPSSIFVSPPISPTHDLTSLSPHRDISLSLSTSPSPSPSPSSPTSSSSPSSISTSTTSPSTTTITSSPSREHDPAFPDTLNWQRQVVTARKKPIPPVPPSTGPSSFSPSSPPPLTGIYLASSPPSATSLPKGIPHKQPSAATVAVALPPGLTTSLSSDGVSEPLPRGHCVSPLPRGIPKGIPRGPAAGAVVITTPAKPRRPNGFSSTGGEGGTPPTSPEPTPPPSPRFPSPSLVQGIPPPRAANLSPQPSPLTSPRLSPPALVPLLSVAPLEVAASVAEVVAEVLSKKRVQLLEIERRAAEEGRALTIEELVTPGDPTQLFSRFEQCGEGASGTVWIADSEEFATEVAIKKMVLARQNSPSILINEVLLMAQCDHPVIVQFFETYLHDETLWVVMEYVDGEDLTDLLGYATLSENHIATIIRECLLALDHLHSKGIMHRDIKSDNLLIRLSDGQVKLTDFGFGARLTTDRPCRTSVVGTTFWMAPEVIMALEYAVPADIWSLAALLHELCNTHPPYINEQPMRALFMICRDGLPQLDEPDLWSTDLRDFIGLAAEMDSARRPTAAELLNHPFIVDHSENISILIPVVQDTRRAKYNSLILSSSDDSSRFSSFLSDSEID